MLTTPAFNALLKTLEEPPKHIIFIFATTEPHEIPITVLSRCQRFDFRRISVIEIADHLAAVCQNEKVKADTNALFLIAKNSDGSMRDAQSALDQLIAYSENEINVGKVRSMFGVASFDIYYQFLEYIQNKDLKNGIEFIARLYHQGLDLKLFITNFIDFIRNIFLIKNKITDPEVIEESQDEIELMKQKSEKFDLEVVDEMIKYLVAFLENFRYTGQFKILVEIAFLNLIDISQKISLHFIYQYLLVLIVLGKDQLILNLNKSQYLKQNLKKLNRSRT